MESRKRYNDSGDMLEHLRTEYEDPNRATICIAKSQFRTLYVNPDKIHDFLSELLYLAAEAGVAEDDLIDIGALPQIGRENPRSPLCSWDSACAVWAGVV